LKVFLIGIGGAGCRIAHQFFKAQKDNIHGVLIDTDMADLSYLKYRYRIPAGEGILGGEGTLKEVGLGMEVFHADKFRITEIVSRLKEDVDCFFVVSALGGGTGGACGVLLEELKQNFIEPVYYIGLLPSEEDLSIITVNAAKGLKEIVRHCNAFFLVDMDRMSRSTRLKGNFKSLNMQLFRYFEALFQVGEFKGRGDIGENTVDFSDFSKTMKGLSVAGFDVQNLEEEPNADKPEAVISLTKRAVESSTLPVTIEDAQKALVVVLGDRKYIDFMGSIPARLWVEKNIGGKEVRGGDLPLNKSGQAEVLVILSDIKKSDEIAKLYQKGEVLGKSHVAEENLSEITDSIANIKTELSALEKEMGEVHRKLSGFIQK
jgi:cell division GTPase FtsZ